MPLRKYQRMVWVSIGLGLLAFIAVTLLSDVQKLLAYAQVFPWLVMIPVLLLRVGNWAIRAAKWFFLLRLVGVRGLSLRDGTSTFIAGLAMAASPGKLAEFIKCFIIKNLTGAPVPSTIPTIIAERTTDGMAIVLWLVIAVAAVAKPEYLPLAILSILSNIVLIAILMIRPLCLRLLGLVHRLPLIGRFADSFRTIYENSYIIYKPRNWLIAVGTGLCSTSLDGIGMYLILIALGKPATAETFWYGMLAISLSVITGSLSGSPSGAGVSDLTIGSVLVAFMGMQPAEAGFATLLARFVQSWWGVFIGLLVGFLDRKRLFPATLEDMIEADGTVGMAAKPDFSGAGTGQ